MVKTLQSDPNWTLQGGGGLWLKGKVRPWIVQLSSAHVRTNEKLTKYREKGNISRGLLSSMLRSTGGYYGKIGEILYEGLFATCKYCKPTRKKERWTKEGGWHKLVRLVILHFEAVCLPGRSITLFFLNPPMKSHSGRCKFWLVGTNFQSSMKLVENAMQNRGPLVHPHFLQAKGKAEVEEYRGRTEKASESEDLIWSVRIIFPSTSGSLYRKMSMYPDLSRLILTFTASPDVAYVIAWLR